MSSIPSSAMPHAYAEPPAGADQEAGSATGPGPGTASRLAAIAAAPALITLGLSMMAMSGLARMVRPRRKPG